MRSAASPAVARDVAGILAAIERFLTRQFPAWKLAEISAEQDLEHSLSPVFPRAFLRRGQSGVAAIASTPECLDTSSILSFGLIWLDYLRRR